MGQMRRVMIVGCGGAGKSTLARALGEALELPVVHLDRHFWYPGWGGTPRLEFRERVRELAGREGWVMDGNYSSTMDIRFSAADTAVFLDYSRWTCLWRILKRRVLYASRLRPDMNPKCPERLTEEFVRHVWNYNATRRPGILRMLRQSEWEKGIYILHDDAEVEAFIRQVVRNKA